MTSIRFTTFPSTRPPPEFVVSAYRVFVEQEHAIGTELGNNAKSNAVLAAVRPGLSALGYAVEGSDEQNKRINRPVFFGENGYPSLNYQVDAFHPDYDCGIEIEAGRATRSNAIYRDIVQAMIMTQVSHLIIAVPLVYRYQSAGKPSESLDYQITVEVARAIYGHDRVSLPFGLTVLGY